MRYRWLIIAVVLVMTGAAQAAVLDGVGGDDGRGNAAADLVAGKPAVVLLTTGRLADVPTGLGLMDILAKELGGEVAVVGVAYGEPAANLAKYREGMSFPVVAGKGDVPAEALGEGGRLPVVLLLGRDGDIKERLPDVPDPLYVAAALGVTYDAGEPGPPLPGGDVPQLYCAASVKGVFDTKALAVAKPKTVYFIFDKDDESRGAYLAELQALADDVGDELTVVPIVLNASAAMVTKLADAEYVDIPVLAAGPLAARRLVGDLPLPVLIRADARATVTAVQAQARVPGRLDFALEEAGPAEEGAPPALVVERVTTLARGVKSVALPTATFDGTGDYVIFSGYFDAGDTDHLWEITVAGKDLRQISRAAAPDVAPAASPDGVHLAFTSARNGGSEVWTCERVHGQFTQLTFSNGDFSAPAYSPDGVWLTAVKRRGRPGEGGNLEPWLFNNRGRRSRPIMETAEDEADAAFAADGAGILYASYRNGDWDIYGADLRGGRRRRLTGPEGEDRMPCASPDGKYVVYASKREDGVFKLWAMNVDGSGKMALTTGPGDALAPRFSPAGDALVFTAARPGGRYEIIKMRFAAQPDYDQPRPARGLDEATPRP